MKFRGRIKSRIRLWAIYCELGYIPWHKPRVKKQRQRSEGEVYMGAKETIPFMDAAGKRTFVHLLLRPGYMIRDYVIRGQHDRYLAPFTALLVFFSVFTLLVAIIRPEGYRQVTDAHHHEVVDNIHISVDSTQVGTRTEDVANAVAATLREGYILIHLDQYPEAADTPWKESVAAVLGDLRSKGIPLFMEGFLLLWLSLAVVLKKYKISMSGAAAVSAFVLCQISIFMLLVSILSIANAFEVTFGIIALALLLDLIQMLGITFKQSLRLTIRTGVLYFLYYCAYAVTLTLIIIAIGWMRA